MKSPANRILALLLSLGLGALACNFPQLSAPAPTPFAPIIWWTNTPGAAATPESASTPAPGGDPAATPEPPLISVTPPPDNVIDTAPYLYYAQAGDTVPALAVRFAVLPEEITSPQPIPSTGLIDPGQLLVIPRRLYNTTAPTHLLPDSEVIFSPTAADFDVAAYIGQYDSALRSYREYLGSTGNSSGADILARVALENSINPRLLLALLEYESGWVTSTPTQPALLDYPLGHLAPEQKGKLYFQLVWAANQLSTGYYGWREGSLTDLVFTDRVSARLAPDLNAGTVALLYFFAQTHTSAEWLQATDPETGFPALLEATFGSPWERARPISVDSPLFPPALLQPRLILPFALGQNWSFSGGPHGAWEREGSLAALDFAPASTEHGCARSDKLVVAAAPGLVVRSERGVIVLDLDGDGREQTGWALVYLHISSDKRIPVGQWVTTGDFLGNPSCEGGYATGTHIHIARKYNGEWMAAGGPVPFVLSGWTAGSGGQPYEGTLARDGVVIKANFYGTASTLIARSSSDP